MSRLKTSGCKRKYIDNERFADKRHAKLRISIEDLPHYESIKSTPRFYNGKINYRLIARFLRGTVGEQWDDVYSEIINRIPFALLDYKKMIFWFVADKVAVENEKLINKKTQRYIWDGNPFACFEDYLKLNPEFTEFYVHPDTNKLVRVPQVSFNKRFRSNEP